MMFSIICLTYKRPELLEESVYSVIQQTYKNWELIIINDCAEQTIVYEHPQVRVINLKEKFKSISDKRNFGKSLVSGDWIMNLDDDDFILPTYLENIKETIELVKSDWVSCQRPIVYFDDNHKKIYLSPVPQTNTFFYTKKVAQTFDYETSGTDELNPFYSRTMNGVKGRKSILLVKPEKCGYVWRQSVDSKRKYSLANLFTSKKSIEEQDLFLKSLEYKKGDILLEPKWNEDYINIIKNNLVIVPPIVAYKKIKGGEDLFKMVQSLVNDQTQRVPLSTVNSINISSENKPVEPSLDDWQKVKPTWLNALKFIEAVKSRGVIPTIMDVTGVDKTYGNRVSDEILRRRKLSCFGKKESGIEPCSRLRQVNQEYFCGGCGCGKKNLARLDSDSPDGYTKLHYPYLECPLKKHGFSNADYSHYIKGSNKIPLSIIIPVLNDNEELNFTIESIRDTSPPEVEIIVIDDKSDVPATVKDDTVKLFRFDERRGAGQARHFGALNASSDLILFIDSHMRFDKNWFNNAISRMISNPKTLWCGACLGLDSEHMDINKPVGVYTGANLVLHQEKNNTIFDGVWKPDIKDKDDYEISCVMGACYFIHKNWYFHIKGLEKTMMWGSEEPILSIKTWLAGGEVRVMKSVRIGHKFRNTASYSTNVSHIIYNKLAYMYMLLPEELNEKIKNKFKKDGNFMEAINILQKNKKELDEEKRYYESIFEHDIYWLCEKFNMNINL